MGIFGWILLMLLIYPIVSLILHVSGKILMGFFGVIALLTIVCIALSFSKWIIGIAIVCGIFGLIGAGEK